MTKPWPLPTRLDEKSREELKPLPQPWPSTQAIVATQVQPQLPATVDCGQKTVAKAEIEIDSAEVVQLVPVGKTKSMQNLRTPWQKGVAPNPKGRPKGSKHKITELARSIVSEDFAIHGRATLERVRLMDPVAYLQLVFKFVPRELILQRELGHCIDFGALTEEQFSELFAEALKRKDFEKLMAAAGFGETLPPKSCLDK